MKYLKLYENINGPTADDYVICKDSNWSSINTFLSTHIGRVIKMRWYNIPKDNDYAIQYHGIPKKYKSYFEISFSSSYPGQSKKPTIWYRYASRDDILYFSSSKEECEIYLESNKYLLQNSKSSYFYK